jgi:hypothetical protein
MQVPYSKFTYMNLWVCRPAFLEEFERLEVELQQLYQDYLVRFRCLAYLEQQQEEAEQVDQERMEARQVMTLFLVYYFHVLKWKIVVELEIILQ